MVCCCHAGGSGGHYPRYQRWYNGHEPFGRFGPITVVLFQHLHNGCDSRICKNLGLLIFWFLLIGPTPLLLPAGGRRNILILVSTLALNKRVALTGITAIFTAAGGTREVGTLRVIRLFLKKAAITRGA
ncbi:unnamed protein product [Ectocarpus sp. CCAP 1310/34]|nr:unnamed protein product [Ectocarpus sp. CCAP 1310/34]